MVFACGSRSPWSSESAFVKVLCEGVGADTDGGVQVHILRRQHHHRLEQRGGLFLGQTLQHGGAMDLPCLREIVQEPLAQTRPRTFRPAWTWFAANNKPSVALA